MRWLRDPYVNASVPTWVSLPAGSYATALGAPFRVTEESLGVVPVYAKARESAPTFACRRLPIASYVYDPVPHSDAPVVVPESRCRSSYVKDRLYPGSRLSLIAVTLPALS